MIGTPEPQRIGAIDRVACEMTERMSRGVSMSSTPALAIARRSVQRWCSLVDRMPPAELLDLALEESAYAVQLAGPRLPYALENLKKIRALIRRIQNRGYTTMARIADHIDRLAVGDEPNAVIDRAFEQLRSTPRESLLDERRVGRAGLPANVLGLLFHAAEHSTRHIGQAITTARILAAR